MTGGMGAGGRKRQNRRIRKRESCGQKNRKKKGETKRQRGARSCSKLWRKWGTKEHTGVAETQSASVNRPAKKKSTEGGKLSRQENLGKGNVRIKRKNETIDRVRKRKRSEGQAMQDRFGCGGFDGFTFCEMTGSTLPEATGRGPP